MDCLTFIVELVKALAWPITIIILASQFRDSINEMLTKIKSLKYKDFEAILENIEKEEKSVPEITSKEPTTQKLPEDKKSTFNDVYNLLESSPNMAVVQAYSYIELEAFLVLRHDKSIDGSTVDKIARSPSLVFRHLRKMGVIDEKVFNLIGHLKALRNGIVHSSYVKLSTEDALRYLEAAEKLYYYLKELSKV